MLAYLVSVIVCVLNVCVSACACESDWSCVGVCVKTAASAAAVPPLYSEKMRLYAFFFFIYGSPKKCVHVEFLDFRDVIFVHQTRSRRPLLRTNRGQTIEFWFSTTFVSFSRRALCKKCNFLQLFPQQPHTGRPHKNCTRDVWAWRIS